MRDSNWETMTPAEVDRAIDDWQLDNRHRFYVPFDAIWAVTVVMALVAGIVIGGLVW